VIVLDTSVLVYAIGEEHPLRAPCRDLIRAVTDERVEATTTVQVIQELAHVRARRRSIANGVAAARDYSDLLSPLLVTSSADLDRGLSLFETVPGLGAFDSVLAATAISAGANQLVSADRAFGEVPGLVHLFPSSDGIAGILN